MGDINLCSNKWDNSDFLHKPLVSQLKQTLKSCDIQIRDVGFSYTVQKMDEKNDQIKKRIQTFLETFGHEINKRPSK